MNLKKVRKLLVAAVAAMGIGSAFAADKPAITYLDWNESKNDLEEVTITDYEDVTATTTVFSDGKTYYLGSGTVTIEGRIEVTGAAKLIIAKDACINAKRGIHLPEGKKLIVCGPEPESYPEDTLKVQDSIPDNCAGIGGNNGESCGELVIAGGQLRVRSGKDAAAIGGGKGGAGGKVTVLSCGSNALIYSYTEGAAIGGGLNGAGGTFIFDPKRNTLLDVDSSAHSAAIGGGKGGAGGTITIKGNNQCRLRVNGGKDSAALGGGEGGAGGTVEFGGAIVSINPESEYSNTNSVSVGGGYGATDQGTVTFTAGYKVEVSDKPATKKEEVTISAFTKDHSARSVYLTPTGKPAPKPDPKPVSKQTTTLEPWFDYVELDPVEDEIATDGVKLTGGKECAAGTVLKLNAKAPKVVKARGDEWVFAGWYSEKAYDSALNNGTQDWRLASGYKFTSLAEDVTLFARFVPKSVEAQYLKVECFTLTDECETGKAIVPIPVEATAYTLPTVKVSGLPSGLKFDAKEGKISGTPKKSGVYAATVTATAAGKTTATTSVKFIVRKGGERVVDVEYDAAMGKVKGAGIYAAGKKVTLKATANKEYVFVGWYESKEAQEPLSQAASYVIDEMPENDVKMYAKFTQTIWDRTSISASVNGLEFSPLSLTQQATNVSCGVNLEWPVLSEALTMPTTVKVSGLPSGLKFTAKAIFKKGSKTEVEIPANTIYGTPTAASKTDKNGNVKPSTVKVTVTSAGKSKAEFVIELAVDPLPVWAVGGFAGSFIGTDIEVAPGVTNHYVGSTTFTVAPKGAISGNAKTALGDVKFKAGSFDHVDADGYYWMTLQGSLTYNRKSMTVPFVAWIQPSPVNGIGTFACISETDVKAGKSLDKAETALQNPWKSRKDLNYPAFPTGKDALSLTCGDLVFDFGKDGVVKFAGMVPGDDGTPVSVSGSTQVMPMGWHKKDGKDVNNTALTSFVNVFVAPRKGLENGFSAEYKIDLISDDAKEKFVDVREYQ